MINKINEIINIISEKKQSLTPQIKKSSSKNVKKNFYLSGYPVKKISLISDAGYDQILSIEYEEHDVFDNFFKIDVSPQNIGMQLTEDQYDIIEEWVDLCDYIECRLEEFVPKRRIKRKKKTSMLSGSIVLKFLISLFC